MKKRCEFQGSVGLEEKFRPPTPCLGEFETSSHPTGGHNRIYCDVCRPFAYRAHELAHYDANRKKIAKKNRAKQRKRAEGAGRVYRPLTGMWRCQYRDEHGKRGEGCLLKFKPKNARQLYCGVCKKLALAAAGKKWREDHAAEITAAASLRWTALRDAAAKGNARPDLGANQSMPGKQTRGRRRDPATTKKIELMARLSLQGKSLWEMAPEVYPERKHTPAAARANTRKLASDHRAEFEAAKLRFRPAEV